MEVDHTHRPDLLLDVQGLMVLNVLVVIATAVVLICLWWLGGLAVRAIRVRRALRDLEPEGDQLTDSERRVVAEVTVVVRAEMQTFAAQLHAEVRPVLDQIIESDRANDNRIRGLEVRLGTLIESLHDANVQIQQLTESLTRAHARGEAQQKSLRDLEQETRKSLAAIALLPRTSRADSQH